MWKRLVIGIGLSVVASISIMILGAIGAFYALAVAIYESKYKKFGYYIGGIFWAIAYSIDTVACVVLAPYLNRHFRQHDSQYYFGSVKTTISLIIGKIYYETKDEYGKLKPQGIDCYNFLEWIEKGHCQLAVMDFEVPLIYRNPNLL